MADRFVRRFKARHQEVLAAVGDTEGSATLSLLLSKETSVETKVEQLKSTCTTEAQLALVTAVKGGCLVCGTLRVRAASATRGR